MPETRETGALKPIGRLLFFIPRQGVRKATARGPRRGARAKIAGRAFPLGRKAFSPTSRGILGDH